MTAEGLHTGTADSERDGGGGVTYRAADGERDGGRGVTFRGGGW